MKTTIIIDELALSEVRPDFITQEYAALRRQEALDLIGDRDAVWTGRPYPTPTCTPQAAFVQDGLSFHHCGEYGTIFASPVPDQKTLDRLARDGAAAELKRKHYTQRFSESQRKSIHAPLLRWVSEILDEYVLDQPATAFVGDNATGIGPNLIEAIKPSRFVYLEQLVRDTLPENAEILEAQEAPEGAFDLLFDIGSLERLADPLDRISLWSRLIKPGAFVAFTTSTASGLEYRLLGPDAPSFVALDRLTLYSAPALTAVLEANGFEVVELSTPGRIDVESIAAAFDKNDHADPLEFWSYAFKFCGKQFRADLQMLLQRHRLSSFARVLARKL